MNTYGSVVSTFVFISRFSNNQPIPHGGAVDFPKLGFRTPCSTFTCLRQEVVLNLKSAISYGYPPPPPRLCRLHVKAAAALWCPFGAVGGEVDNDKARITAAPQLPGSSDRVFSRRRKTWASLLSHPRGPGEGPHVSAFETQSVHLEESKSGTQTQSEGRVLPFLATQAEALTHDVRSLSSAHLQTNPQAIHFSQWKPNHNKLMS